MNEYTVVFDFTAEDGTSKQYTKVYTEERAAALMISAATLASNMAVVSYSENIDLSKYRF